MDSNKKENIKIDKASFISYKTNNISKDYTLGKTLGQGSFGTVRKAIHKATKQERAIKILKKSGQDEEKFFLEVNILSKLTHPNIMHIYEFYEDKANYYIVSELCKGGELFDMITEKGCFNESEACPLMHQLMSAICYCHQNRIVHRDLKPENILLEDKNRDHPVIKLIDWGGARYFSKHKKMSKVNGTPYYIAPEVLNEVYDEKCDIWSAGVIFYILLCGYPPFNGETDKEIMDAVKKGTFDFPEEEWDVITEEGKDLIKKMLTYDPKKRLSANQVLSHPWFTTFKGNINIINKQTDIKDPMRSILIDWLISLQNKFFYNSKTLFLAINLIDRYLSEKQIFRERFQLLGITALFIASKYEEMYMKNINEYVEITAKTFNKYEILEMESQLIDLVNFNLELPLSIDFFGFSG